MEKTRRIEQPFELKFSSSGSDEGTFSGYGACFGNVDSYGDVIQKGAFKDTLRAWEDKGKYPPMLLQHGGGFLGGADDLLPIGKWTQMEENTKGLKVEGQLFAMKTERGQYLYEGMKAGELDGLSIGYRPKKFISGTKPGEPRRTLTDVDLVELSVVTFPANDKARVGNVKAAEIDEIKSLSESEDFLREVGMSKKTARDFISRIAKIARREAGDDQDVTGLVALTEQLRLSRQF